MRRLQRRCLRVCGKSVKILPRVGNTLCLSSLKRDLNREFLALQLPGTDLTQMRSWDKPISDPIGKHRALVAPNNKRVHLGNASRMDPNAAEQFLPNTTDCSDLGFEIVHLLTLFSSNKRRTSPPPPPKTHDLGHLKNVNYGTESLIPNS